MLGEQAWDETAGLGMGTLAAPPVFVKVGDRLPTTLITEQIFKQLIAGRQTVVQGLGTCEIGLVTLIAGAQASQSPVATRRASRPILRSDGVFSARPGFTITTMRPNDG